MEVCYIVIPNTKLAHEFSKRGIFHPGIESTDFTAITPTLANVMVYMLTAFRPPKKIHEFFWKFVKENTEEQPKYPLCFTHFQIADVN